MQAADPAPPRPASGVPVAALAACLLALLLLDSSLLRGGSPAHHSLRPTSSPGGGGGGAPPLSLQPAPGKFAPLPGSDEVSFNVIVTSTGRAELPVFMEALAPQLTSRDYITLISDKPSWHLHVAETFSHVRCNCTKLLIENAEPLGWWGHGSRNKWQRSLPGAFHLHADDDDFYTPDAFEIIRSVVTTLVPRVYIFRVVKENYYPAKNRKELIAFPVLDNNNPLAVGLYNGGTPCGVVRNVGAELPIWRPTIGGDAVFWEDAIVRVYR